MYAGLPVVATSVGGIPEMILSGQGGELVAPKDSDALAAAIEKLIDAPELRRALGQNALADAEKKFGLPAMLEKTKKIYE
jgi:glycosyltransferase involved in cell wall biosynthesis